jgi:hypothetical protein
VTVVDVPAESVAAGADRGKRCSHGSVSRHLVTISLFVSPSLFRKGGIAWIKPNRLPSLILRLSAYC